MKLIHKSAKKLTLLGVIISLTACVSDASYQTLSVPPAVQAQYQMPDSSPQINSEEVLVSWWESLGDAQLSALINQAMQHNNDVGIAIANLERARSDLRGAGLELLPDIGSSVRASDQRLADAAAIGLSDNRFTQYQAGFDASWELDLFGRLRQQRLASQADLAATQAELDQVYVSVAAEVARSYIQLRGAQLRLSVGERNVDVISQSADMTQQLMEGGLGDNLDVQRALAQLELARAALPSLRAQVAVNINRLSVLTGQMPAALQASLSSPQGLPSIPPSIAVGDPIDLLKRRPDIRKAERQLASAIARYKVSVAQLYPQVSISGSIGFLATAFADLGSAGTLTHIVGPQITWDAFNFGRLQNQIDAADADIQAQLEVFEKTLLSSFEEVDNAMVTLTSEIERQESLRAAAQASAQTSNIARQRFEAGADSFLDLLDAQRTQLAAEDQLASSETALALQVIALYKALGGGWQLHVN